MGSKIAVYAFVYTGLRTRVRTTRAFNAAFSLIFSTVSADALIDRSCTLQTLLRRATLLINRQVSSPVDVVLEKQLLDYVCTVLQNEYTSVPSLVT